MIQENLFSIFFLASRFFFNFNTIYFSKEKQESKQTTLLQIELGVAERHFT